MCKTHSKYFLSCFANDTNHQAESERPIAADTSQIYSWMSIWPLFPDDIDIFNSRTAISSRRAKVLREVNPLHLNERQYQFHTTRTHWNKNNHKNRNAIQSTTLRLRYTLRQRAAFYIIYHGFVGSACNWNYFTVAKLFLVSLHKSRSVRRMQIGGRWQCGTTGAAPQVINLLIRGLTLMRPIKTVTLVLRRPQFLGSFQPD